MRTHWIDLDSLDKIRDALEITDRGANALAVLRHQLQWEHATAEQMKSEWSERIGQLSHEGRTFLTTGNDLFRLPWQISAATAVRANYRVGAGRWIDVAPLPEPFGKRNFTLKLRICAGKAEAITIYMERKGQGSQNLRYRTGVWTALECNEVKVDANEWVELEVRCICPDEEAKVREWTFTRFVNGQELKLRPGLRCGLPSPVHRLAIAVEGGSEPILVGGAEWSWR
jgi:hypothetical protein